jgi:hypothetical protein
MDIPTLTEKQLTVMQALNTACGGKFSIKVDTYTIAQYANSNTLAVTKVLETLVKRRYVRNHLISNASTSGGAYKNGYSITPIGRNKIKDAN